MHYVAAAVVNTCQMTLSSECTCSYQTEHLCSGFMGFPRAHLYASAKSFELDNGTCTLLTQHTVMLILSVLISWYYVINMLLANSL